MKKYNYFPLVGILASKGRKSNSFRGDAVMFKAIQKELMNKGGLSFVFTTDDIQDNSIIGYVFSEKNKKWGKASFPFPPIIYNKISSRMDEKTTDFIKLQQSYQQKNKTFFNPYFFNKWQCYQALTKEQKLLTYLPKTWHHTNNLLILNLLKFGAIYAKPIKGRKGKGIYKLKEQDKIYYIFTKDTFKTYHKSSFLDELEYIIPKDYILQQEIETDTVEGCKYDLRIHSLYSSGSYQITGIGVRKAAKNSIITHVPNGGEIISFASVGDNISINELDHLTELVGNSLSKSFGFVGEFSMDIGITPHGKPYIFEVNSKPMLFDEGNIQKKRITGLTELFIELANKKQ